MLYEIQLKTKCEYGRPAAGRQLLRVMPAEAVTMQRLIAGAIEVRPAPSERSDRYDFFVNRVTEVAFAAPAAEIEITMRARVDRFAQPPTLDLSPGLAGLKRDIATDLSVGPSSPQHFLDTSPMAGPSPAIAAYARDVAVGKTVFEMANALNLAINRDMKYDGDATEVDTPLEEAFENRRGVCQDFTHIMIACLRELGIPAGYVSGFLRTEPPKGKPRLEGADAMHAWVQVWCGREAGWVEFDPTNAMMAGLSHIVAARGRDYTDVPPLRGLLRTAGAQEVSQAVDVIPVG